VLERLESSQFSAWIRNELWGWPLALTLHAFGTALVVGFILIIGLRLLGLFGMIPYTLLNRLFPVVWAALVLQFVSGFMLWMAKPTQYVSDIAFVLKFLLVIVGIVLTLSFYRTIKREAPSWDAKGSASSRAVQLGTAAFLVWCVVLIAGRLTAHLGSI
jgi:predicted ABC-type exoprotein transport system permease subunit